MPIIKGTIEKKTYKKYRQYIHSTRTLREKRYRDRCDKKRKNLCKERKFIQGLALDKLEHMPLLFETPIKKRILVLCADNNSFLNKNWKHTCRSFININNYEAYFYGWSLRKLLPFRICGDIRSSQFLKSFGKNFFDCILIEYAPRTQLVYLVQERINIMLKSEGVIITPDYNNNKAFDALYWGTFFKKTGYKNDHFLTLQKKKFIKIRTCNKFK